jgi:hypothetical protein
MADLPDPHEGKEKGTKSISRTNIPHRNMKLVKE